MADLKKAFEMYKAGFNCGQIVTTFCSNICGYDEKIARAALGGFGGGMQCGENCSAVIGAVVSLGLYCNQSEYNDSIAGEKVRKMTSEFTKRFKDNYGSLSCRDLMKPDDIHRCAEFIAFSEELVTELIENDKNK